ncbi:hypothetical protein LCGC14_1987860 [marine sediment metagenome]|uniref:Band 7 domain-containing protein n=1 Tax=marine sediment metagenome TaxID=412755 RepID=A0A0F9I407_9ZZZZ
MEWLADLLKNLRDFLPRKYFINPNEGGVRITLGKHVKTLEPGWYYYWPVIQECEGMNTSPQIVDLRPQSALTNDTKDIAISGGIKYRVSDARKALLDVQDYDKSIQTLALGIICEFISNHKFEDLSDLSELKENILSGIRDEATGMGLKIMKVYITDIGRTKNIRIMGGDRTIIEEDKNE